MTLLFTPRLRLEPFSDAHLDGLYTLNSDPEVVRYIGNGQPQTLEETRAMILRVKQHWLDFNCGWWALIEIDTNEIIGAGGIQPLARIPGNPLEIGWRLRKDRWHQGYASEAARVMADFAFNTMHNPDLTAVCHPDNAASAIVMERLGMTFRGLETWYDTTTRAYYMTREQFVQGSAEK
jgi:ribosomal-protein-alanine N-acetyltransferase